jgi:hypothetical protein
MLFQGCDNVNRYHGAHSKAEYVSKHRSMRKRISLTHENSIVAYLNRFIHFPVMTKITSGSPEQFQQSNETVVVGYFDAEESKEQRLFDETAEKLYPEFVFGMCDDSSVAADEDVKTPAVVVYRRGEERSVFDLDEDSRSISRSIRLAARQDFTKLAPEIHEDILDVSPYVWADMNILYMLTLLL